MVQVMVVKKIPAIICKAIPGVEPLRIFLKTAPKPARVGISKMSINKIYSIKKDCLKISNLFFIIEVIFQMMKKTIADKFQGCQLLVLLEAIFLKSLDYQW